jgi:hypothetical protein
LVVVVLDGHAVVLPAEQDGDPLVRDHQPQGLRDDQVARRGDADVQGGGRGRLCYWVVHPGGPVQELDGHPHDRLRAQWPPTFAQVVRQGPPTRPVDVQEASGGVETHLSIDVLLGPEAPLEVLLEDLPRHDDLADHIFRREEGDEVLTIHVDRVDRVHSRNCHHCHFVSKKNVMQPIKRWTLKT